MVEVKPFRGLRYDPARTGGMANVMSPPYDVISPAYQDELYARSPYNAVRLVLGKNDRGQRYDEAAAALAAWRDEGVLVREDRESLYVYSQRFTVDGTAYDRTGFIGLCRLVDFGDGVYPHEKTLKGPLADRMKLTEATGTQFGQIFVMYDDRERRIDAALNRAKEGTPLFEAVSDDGLNHRLWRIDDPAEVADITACAGECSVVIADGHHRYTTALRYAREHTGNPAAQFQMMTFVNSFSEGMLILPTNRLLHGLPAFDPADALRQMGEYFDVSEMTQDALLHALADTPVMVDKEQNLKNHLFGLHLGATGKSYLLTLKDRDVMDRFTPGVSDIYRKLDVNIVHRLIIEEVFGITEKMQREAGMITYVKGNEETCRQLSDPEHQVGLFVRPPLMREVFLTARAGETMPQKSTYFFPKIWSGLVMNPLDDRN